jgi:PAS domain S-box-containing protein
MLLSSLPRPLRIYSLAILAPAIALGLTLLLQNLLQNGISSFFYVAVVISTGYGGIRAGIVTIVLSFLAINYCFTPPIGEFNITYTSDWIRLGVFSFVALSIAGLSNNLRQSQQKNVQLSQALLAEQSMQLQGVQAQLDTILAVVKVGQWERDLINPVQSEQKVYWSPEHEVLYGLQPGTFDGTSVGFDRCAHPDDLAGIYQTFEQAIASRNIFAHEFRIIWPNGTIHWIEARGQCIYDDDGRLIRAVGISIDIDDRKQSEALLHQAKVELEQRVIDRTAVLQETERRWRSLLENVQLIVVSLNIQGCVEYVNPFFLKLSGYELEQVQGKNWFEHFLPPQQAAQVKVTFQELLEHDFHPYYQNSILTRTGETRVIAWNNTLLRNTQGQIIGTTSIGEDITQRQIVEQMKNDFVSIVSHELRTPLTAIRGSLGLLAAGVYDQKPEKGKQMLQVAAEQSDRLVRLVNDILDLRRLESGVVRLEMQSCNAHRLLEQAIEVLSASAAAAEVRLAVLDSAIASPLTVWAAPDSIMQTLTNLLSNAIKFSPSNTVVTLAAEPFQSELAEKMVLFSVADQGRGIPRSNLKTIFERFQQVDASDSRQKGGTGLGLTICRQIVEQHGGRIWVESEVGQGSRFYFTLPQPRV